MDIDEEIQKIKTFQNLTGGYTEVALENIQNSPFLFIKHLKEAEIELGDTFIKVELLPKRTPMAWFYRTFRKKLIKANLLLLSKYIYFWVPKTPNMPKISFSWKK